MQLVNLENTTAISANQNSDKYYLLFFYYKKLYDSINLHVAKVRAAECSLHSKAVSDSHLAPHHHARGGLFALAHSELTPAERELVRCLGQNNKNIHYLGPV